MDKATTCLLKLLMRQGFDVQRTKGRHYLIRKRGAFVTVLPSTPSDHRGRKNALAALRRAGFDDPKRKTR